MCAPGGEVGLQVGPRQLGDLRRLREVTDALLEAGIAPSIGTVGDALDNALMESTIGLFKTELVDHDRARSWSGAADLERETASWVHWYNTSRLHHSIGKMSPIEFEELHELTSPSADQAVVA